MPKTPVNTIVKAVAVAFKCDSMGRRDLYEWWLDWADKYAARREARINNENRSSLDSVAVS